MKKENKLQELRMNLLVTIVKMARGKEELKDLEKKAQDLVLKDHFKYSEEIQQKAIARMMFLALGFNLDEEEGLKTLTRQEVIKNKYTTPLVNIIQDFCNACFEKSFFVTNFCQGCLKRPCQTVCPKDAIFFDENNKSKIEKEKCIKCGQCARVCPYSAIVERQRPCSLACGVDAIFSNDDGKAQIDYEKCVSCGSCIKACPFGAIFDKSQIFQLICEIEKGTQIIACIAPAFVGQFGEGVLQEQVKTALKMIGFVDVVEVAVGADLCSYGEAEEFIEKVPNSQPFMATSCCPAWSVMAKKNFKDLSSYISMELTPMAFTGRLIKNRHKDVKVAFIGPCTAKKLEAFRKSVRSDIDFVLTFEELMAIFKEREIDLKSINCDANFNEATKDGRNFAVSNGVATAVCECIKKMDPKKEVLVDSAQGLKDCKKMLLLAKAGKRNGYLLEGMACKGGCVGGAGVLAPFEKATKLVNEFADSAEKKHAYESEYLNLIEELLDDKEK